MIKADQSTYDAVIIGAGIGGLVCGCYLAKSGMKVLIAEQHFKPGGYCTSFKRNEFMFDAAAHCFGAYRKGGITRKIFEDLAIENRLKIVRYDPSNTVIMPNVRVSYRSDLNETIKGFQAVFPEESKSIEKFFHFLINPDVHSFLRIRNWTLKSLLDTYFNNYKLKTIIAAPLLGLGGLPPVLMSAFIGVKLISEFLLDGGYHPKGGMQALPDALAEKFKELGGELRTSCPVKKIKVENNMIKGVVVENGDFIFTKYVVSNSDARQTFLNLLGKEKLDKDFYYALKKMVPSTSNFVLYLGLDSYYDSLPSPGTTICFFSHYNLDRACQAMRDGNIERYGGYMFYVSADRPTILAIIPAPYKNKKYWINNKCSFEESFIKQIEKYSIPHLSQHIIFKEAATPHTLCRYTSNYRGASFGWAGTPSQLAVAGFKKCLSIQGLYLTGHWTTQGLGISGVIYVGHDTAKLILRKEKLCYN